MPFISFTQKFRHAFLYLPLLSSLLGSFLQFYCDILEEPSRNQEQRGSMGVKEISEKWQGENERLGNTKKYNNKVN